MPRMPHVRHRPSSDTPGRSRPPATPCARPRVCVRVCACVRVSRLAARHACVTSLRLGGGLGPLLRRQAVDHLHGLVASHVGA
jgi:hypothetical protein